MHQSDRYNKKFPMTWCMKIIYVSSSNQKSAAFSGCFCFFKEAFLYVEEEEVGGPEVNVCWEFHMQRRLDWESRSKTSIKEAKREHTNLFRISFLWAAKLLSLLSSQKVCENASLKQDWKCFLKSKTAILEVTAPPSDKNGKNIIESWFSKVY